MKESVFEVDPDFRQKALYWAKQFPFSVYLNSNHYGPYPFSGFRNLLAVGSNEVVFQRGNAFEKLRQKPKDTWWFGYLGYDLKNEIHHLNSDNPDPLEFPDLLLFEAGMVLEWQTDIEVKILAPDPDLIRSLIENQSSKILTEIKPTRIHAGLKKESYFKNVGIIQNLIEEGQFYEINLCQYFLTERAMDGLSAYQQLNEISPMPFSGWFRGNDFEIACASPERYLKKTGRSLISQPIKGSAKRHPDPTLDELSKNELIRSEKERAENMMIVDLVRNDLARVSETGSTTVPEIFGIYSFQQVHQMISTVQSTLRPECDWVEAILSTFPMGSMTGAPKLEVMHWIEKLETQRRVAFSGALGYIGPGNDFDFNVLIRSIFINHKKNKAGFAVGSAITIDSQPESEWEECEAKAKAILQILGSAWDQITRD